MDSPRARHTYRSGHPGRHEHSRQRGIHPGDQAKYRSISRAPRVQHDLEWLRCDRSWAPLPDRPHHRVGAFIALQSMPLGHQIDMSHLKCETHAVIDRRVPTPERFPILWICSAPRCGYTRRSVARPKRHVKHPLHKMVKAETKRR